MASVRLSYVSREATAGRGRVCDKAPSGPHKVITQFEAQDPRNSCQHGDL